MRTVPHTTPTARIDLDQGPFRSRSENRHCAHRSLRLVPRRPNIYVHSTLGLPSRWSKCTRRPSRPCRPRQHHCNVAPSSLGALPPPDNWHHYTRLLDLFLFLTLFARRLRFAGASFFLLILATATSPPLPPARPSVPLISTHIVVRRAVGGRTTDTLCVRGRDSDRLRLT